MAGHASHPFDSLSPHTELPMSVELPTTNPLVNADV